jgi:hypothetical protein
MPLAVPSDIPSWRLTAVLPLKELLNTGAQPFDGIGSPGPQASVTRGRPLDSAPNDHGVTAPVVAREGRMRRTPGSQPTLNDQGRVVCPVSAPLLRSKSQLRLTGSVKIPNLFSQQRLSLQKGVVMTTTGVSSPSCQRVALSDPAFVVAGALARLGSRYALGQHTSSTT